MADHERLRIATAATGLAVLLAGCGAVPGNALSPSSPGNVLSASSLHTFKPQLASVPARSKAATPTSARTARTTATAPKSATSSPSPIPQSQAPISETGPCGTAAPETPGGADPWGGCWPGPGNTGPAAGTSLTPYTGKVLPDGSCMITSNTVINGKTLACQIIIRSGNLTLENSQLNGEVYNYGSGSVLIVNTTINGGADPTETVLGSNITIKHSNLYGNQHEVYCGDNCTIENSWLHDNHNFGAADHQNGFLTTGGSNYYLQHNAIFCVGGCTGDVTFLGGDSVAVVNKNLLVATDAAFCLYPGNAGSSSAIVNQMTITDNVFQHGSNGKCATYGPVYAWNAPNNNPGTTGYHNVWSGNIWSDGKTLSAP